MGLKEEYARDIAGRYSAALKAADYDAAAALYVADCTHCWFMAPVAKSRQAIAAGLRASAQHVDADAWDWNTFNDEYMEVGGGMMLARGEYKMHFGGKDATFWFTSLCKKVDGKWHIVADASAPSTM